MQQLINYIRVHNFQVPTKQTHLLPSTDSALFSKNHAFKMPNSLIEEVSVSKEELSQAGSVLAVANVQPTTEDDAYANKSSSFKDIAISMMTSPLTLTHEINQQTHNQNNSSHDQHQYQLSSQLIPQNAYPSSITAIRQYLQSESTPSSFDSNGFNNSLDYQLAKISCKKPTEQMGKICQNGQQRHLPNQHMDYTEPSIDSLEYPLTPIEVPLVGIMNSKEYQKRLSLIQDDIKLPSGSCFEGDNSSILIPSKILLPALYEILFSLNQPIESSRVNLSHSHASVLRGQDNNLSQSGARPEEDTINNFYSKFNGGFGSTTKSDNDMKFHYNRLLYHCRQLEQEHCQLAESIEDAKKALKAKQDDITQLKRQQERRNKVLEWIISFGNIGFTSSQYMDGSRIVSQGPSQLPNLSRTMLSAFPKPFINSTKKQSVYSFTGDQSNQTLSESELIESTLVTGETQRRRKEQSKLQNKQDNLRQTAKNQQKSDFKLLLDGGLMAEDILAELRAIKEQLNQHHKLSKLSKEFGKQSSFQEARTNQKSFRDGKDSRVSYTLQQNILMRLIEPFEDKYSSNNLQRQDRERQQKQNLGVQRASAYGDRSFRKDPKKINFIVQGQKNMRDSNTSHRTSGEGTSESFLLKLLRQDEQFGRAQIAQRRSLAQQQLAVPVQQERKKNMVDDKSFDGLRKQMENINGSHNSNDFTQSEANGRKVQKNLSLTPCMRKKSFMREIGYPGQYAEMTPILSVSPPSSERNEEPSGIRIENDNPQPVHLTRTAPQACQYLPNGDRRNSQCMQPTATLIPVSNSQTNLLNQSQTKIEQEIFNCDVKVDLPLLPNQRVKSVLLNIIYPEEAENTHSAQMIDQQERTSVLQDQSRRSISRHSMPYSENHISLQNSVRRLPNPRQSTEMACQTEQKALQLLVNHSNGQEFSRPGKVKDNGIAKQADISSFDLNGDWSHQHAYIPPSILGSMSPSLTLLGGENGQQFSSLTNNPNLVPFATTPMYRNVSHQNDVSPMKNIMASSMQLPGYRSMPSISNKMAHSAQNYANNYIQFEAAKEQHNGTENGNSYKELFKKYLDKGKTNRKSQGFKE